MYASTWALLNIITRLLLLPGGCVAAGITLAAGACMPFVAPYATRTASLAKLSEADFQQAVALGPTPSDQCCVDAGAFVKGVSTEHDKQTLNAVQLCSSSVFHAAQSACACMRTRCSVVLLQGCACEARMVAYGPRIGLTPAAITMGTLVQVLIDEEWCVQHVLAAWLCMLTHVGCLTCSGTDSSDGMPAVPHHQPLQMSRCRLYLFRTISAIGSPSAGSGSSLSLRFC